MPLLNALTGCVALFALYVTSSWCRKRRDLPPGPFPLPIVGNILDMPSAGQLHPWKSYNSWFEKYGNLVYAKIFQQHVVLIGSHAIAQDLLDKNGLHFSDRPPNVMMGWDFNFAIMNYTPWYRRHRKAFHEFFNPTAVQRYQDIQYREVEALLKRLEESPERFLQHIRHTLSAIIMDVAYGIQIQDANDPFIAVAEEAFGFLARAGVAGSFIVDLFPFMQHLPSWAPGTSFQYTAKYARTVITSMIERPFEFVKAAAEVGYKLDPVAPTLYNRLSNASIADREELEIIAKNISGVTYSAIKLICLQTTSAVQSFFLAMVMFPEVQRTAQAELDTVVGPGGFPNLADKERMPYVGQALVREVLRWQASSFLSGVPHCNLTDFTYKGFHIPAGTMILASTWRILHDPEIYPDPERFYPERFLKDGIINPEIREPDVAFGYGRRICPGMYISNNNLFLIAASVLARFDILSALDDADMPLKYEVKSTTGMFSFPYPFKCQIRPRGRS
ncbi:cytochrome P450 [Mycena sanguinolenta]|nr:cytochrome P450 [Mycena sanguinolenta]